MESMEEALPETNGQALHYLIHDAQWDHRAVMDEVARGINTAIGGSERSCLLIDETYFAKKGRHSAGVARQWNGRMGKTDNSQVGVFAALCRDTFAVPIDCDLYLPEVWTSDPRRMRKAHVPEEHQGFKTKTELALDQIKRAVTNGVDFSWISVDGGYGKCPHFIDEIDEMGLRYFADVHKSQLVFMEDPKPHQVGKRGKLTVDAEPIRLDDYLGNSGAIDWEYLTVRAGTKGPIDIRCKRFEAWVWSKQDQHHQAKRVTVLISQMANGSDTKYGISNADASLSTQTLAYWQRQRFWIEQSFRDGKSEVGMHQYQVRSWHGWHRHMALSMMALLYMTLLKISMHPEVPLLSAHDARDLLAADFAQRHSGRNFPQVDLLEVIRRRHRRRMDDIRNSYRRRGLEVPEKYASQ